MTPTTTVSAGRPGRPSIGWRSAALALVLLTTQVASATEYFVKIDGHDGTAGTSADTALRSIQKAADCLAPGDTLTIAPGEYPQRFVVKQSGTAEHPITIRAAIPGFTVIRGNECITGFKKVDGKRFVWSVHCPRPVYRVVERDTQLPYLEAPSPADMDQFRRSHLYDGRTKTLYVHTSDGQPPDQHVLATSVIPAFGVDITGEYVHVDGLVIEGFFPTQVRDSIRGFGMSVKGGHHEIRGCTFLFNGGGIIIDAKDCVIRDNLLIGNLSPGDTEIGQIYCTGQSERVRILNNTVLDAQMYGIRNYGAPAESEVSGNIIKSQYIGLDYKASKGKRSATYNVAAGCSELNWFSGAFDTELTENHNTFQKPSEWGFDKPKPGDTGFRSRMGKNTLLFGADQQDPRFADPDHLDYRLQADSPYRGKGPDGSDLGAYRVEPNIFFVHPTGDDNGDGLSVARAFKTVGRAMKECRPGVTIYLCPGTYPEFLRPGGSGGEGSPVVIRARGKDARASVAGLELKGSQHIQIEGLAVTGAVVVTDSRDIRLRKCRRTEGAGDALTLQDSTNVRLGNLTLSSTQGSAVRVVGACRDIRITSSILLSAGGPPLNSDIGQGQGLFCEYNDYVAPSGPVATVAGASVTAVSDMPPLTGGDRCSISADPQLTGSPQASAIKPTSPCAARGEAGTHIGAGDIARDPLEPQITEVQLRDVTPTSASLTWWTPNTSNAAWRDPLEWYRGHPVHSEIQYGTSPAYGSRSYSFGDLYHRVTLHGLKPDTLYQFRIVIAGQPWYESVAQNDEPLPPPAGWRGAESQTFAFRTPKLTEWKPTSRTFYVAPTGGEANSGLEEKAPTTLTAASDRVRAGDTVVLLDGVYTETFAPASSGVEGAPITLRARAHGRACLDGSSYLRPSAVALFWKDQVVIDGVVIRRFADRGYGCRAGMFASQILLARCGAVTIKNCVLSGWGLGYGKGVVARGSDHVAVTNCVITGFAHAVNARNSRLFILQGNTWYVPLICNFTLDGRVVVKNNLFFGQERQKVFQHEPMVTYERPTESDYNAFYFGPDNPARFIGYGLRRKAEADMGGVKRIQQELGMDLHSIEASIEDVALSGPVPTQYLNLKLLSEFYNRVRSGELIPTIEMFTPPARSRLNAAGENGQPIGARPPR